MAISLLKCEHESLVLQERDQIPLSQWEMSKPRRRGGMASWLRDREVLGGGGVMLNLERRVDFSSKRVRGKGEEAEGRHGGEEALGLFLELQFLT